MSTQQATVNATKRATIFASIGATKQTAHVKPKFTIIDAAN
jgi:hypothetical protein